MGTYGTGEKKNPQEISIYPGETISILGGKIFSRRDKF
jgi:hypothetical protein